MQPAIPRAGLRVLVADDHAVVRDALVQVLNDESGIDVVGEADSVSTGWAGAIATRPDVALLDARLPDGSGIDLCRQLRSALPMTRCVILTGLDDPMTLAAAFDAGASAFVNKQVRPSVLIDAVRQAAATDDDGPGTTQTILVGPATPTRESVRDPRLTNLTTRELEVLHLVGEGLSNRQIGDRLGIAERTANNTASRILSKLHLQTRAQAAVLATELLHDQFALPERSTPRLRPPCKSRASSYFQQPRRAPRV